MNILQEIVEQQKSGEAKGICSVCSSSPLVIDAALLHAKETDDCVLIEATANQVNQNGGYTGMTPEDFRAFVLERADLAGLGREKVILGGDHLGPVAWQKMHAEEAMDLAKVLVYDFAAAGFTKIHLDASMPLGGDGFLSTEKIADRTVTLLRQAEAGAAAYSEKHPGAEPPVYVIGSEVPTPGGSGEETGLHVTDPSDLKSMLVCFKNRFENAGFGDAWDRVVAAVVQPGVEFGNDGIHEYIPEEAADLVQTAMDIPGIVLEGHSTDYQPESALRSLVEDGVAILKVGPALTFAAREGLFALAYIEKELGTGDPSCFIEKLDECMLKDRSNWAGHYTADEPMSSILRKFSLSDRSRYYMALPEMTDAQEKLFENIRNSNIPAGLMTQFLPVQAKKIASGELSDDPKAIVIDKVQEVLGTYGRACGR